MKSMTGNGLFSFIPFLAFETVPYFVSSCSKVLQQGIHVPDNKQQANISIYIYIVIAIACPKLHFSYSRIPLILRIPMVLHPYN